MDKTPVGNIISIILLVALGVLVFMFATGSLTCKKKNPDAPAPSPSSFEEYSPYSYAQNSGPQYDSRGPHVHRAQSASEIRARNSAAAEIHAQHKASVEASLPVETTQIVSAAPKETINTIFNTAFAPEAPCTTTSSSEGMTSLFSGTPFDGGRNDDITQVFSNQQPTKLANLMPASFSSNEPKVVSSDNFSSVINKQGFDKFVKASGDMRFGMIDRVPNPTGLKGVVRDDIRPPPRITINPNTQIMFNDSEQRIDAIIALTGRAPSVF